MGENELTRKVFSTIGKASGASQEEIIEAWDKKTSEDLKMLTELANDLKEVYDEYKKRSST